MAQNLTAAEIDKVARLARLKLSADERERFAAQLGDVLGYIALLDELQTGDIEPMAHAIEFGNVFRKDEPRPSLSREQALANAPASDGRFFRVPPILDEG